MVKLIKTLVVTGLLLSVLGLEGKAQSPVFVDPDRGFPNEPLNAPPEEEIRQLQIACGNAHNQLMVSGQGYALFSIINQYTAVCFYVYKNNPQVYGQFNNGGTIIVPNYLSPQQCANQMRQTGNRFCQ